jgi:hypothetical protein
MKMRQIILTACIACLSTSAIATNASAQAYDPELNVELGNLNQLIGEGNALIDEIEPVEAQNLQNQIDELISLCYQGDSSACSQYNLLNRQLDRQHEYYLNRLRSYDY